MTIAHLHESAQSVSSKNGDRDSLVFESFTIADGLIVASTIAGPVIAVQVQKWVERLTAEKDRHLSIYRALMATRATRLVPHHVEAINAIPVEFYKDPDIINRWDEYYSHICKEAKSDGEDAVWTSENQRLFIQLMTAIGRKLGYNFNAAQMERTYFPKAHQHIEHNQWEIQRHLARWLAGDLAVKIEVVAVPGIDPETSAQQEELRVAAVNWLKGGVVPLPRPAHQPEAPNGAVNGH